MQETKGKYLNRNTDELYKKEHPFPQMVGRDTELKACHENHVFLFPLNPSQEIYQKYKDAVSKWNSLHFDSNRKQIDGKIKSGLMKACYLGLVFRDTEGQEQVINVLQTSRYIYSDDTDEVIQSMHEDAEFFIQEGFDVVREKIEARAYGIDGIPLTDEQMSKYDKYFEFHLKVGRKNRDKNHNPITEEEINELRGISRQISEKFQVPVPLSFNVNKNKFNDDGEGHQRFLNIRFRKFGRENCAKVIQELEDCVAQQTSYEVIKAIQEYVWYDSFTALDKGWIDYTPEEMAKLFPNQKDQY